MVAIAASDITYTITNREFVPGGGYKQNVQIAFGDGALTYVTGGIAVAKAKLGCPNIVKSVILEESAVTSGYLWDYDKSAVKLKGFYFDYDGSADGAAIEIDSGVAPAAQTIHAVVEGY